MVNTCAALDANGDFIKIPGEGVAVQRLREAGVRVFGEDELDEAEKILIEQRPMVQAYL